MMTSTIHGNNRLIQKSIARVFPACFAATLAASISLMMDSLLAGSLIGSLSIAAVAIGNPVINILRALVQTISCGAAVQITVNIGRGNQEEINRSYSIGIFGTINMDEKLQGCLQSMVMKICNGIGRGRMTREITMRETYGWNTTGIVTSEYPLVRDFRNSGSMNRVLMMQGTAPQNCPYIEELEAGELLDIFEKNHGFGGRDFIHALLDTGEEELNRRLQEIRRQVRMKARGLGKSEGQELPVAVMLLADEIAERYLFQDGVRITVEEAADWMMDSGTVDQNERFYEQLMEYVAMNSGKFEDWRLMDVSNTAYWGRYNKKEGKVAILPSVLKAFAKEHSVDIGMFLKALDEKGLLSKDKAGNLARNVYSRLLNKGQRMYEICMKKEDSEKTEDAFIEGPEELPFFDE